MDNGNGNGVNSSNSSCFPLFGSTSHCILDIHRCDWSELKFYFPSEGDIHIDMIMVFEMFLNSGISVLKNKNNNSNGNKIRKKINKGKGISNDPDNPSHSDLSLQ